MTASTNGDGTHAMTLAEIREALGVTEVSNGVLFRQCPVHLDERLKISIRADGSLKVEDQYGCREAVLTSALGMEPDAFAAIRVIRRQPVTNATPSPDRSDADASPKSEEDEVFEALKALDDERVKALSIDDHLVLLTHTLLPPVDDRNEDQSAG